MAMRGPNGYAEGLELRQSTRFLRRNQDEMLADFIDTGFKTVIVYAAEPIREWIGKEVTRDFILCLKENGVDIH
jgi:diphthamide synthase (EF-2-diphthine--ammonia ligase)